jgi:hypothetical protein
VRAEDSYEVSTGAVPTHGEVHKVHEYPTICSYATESSEVDRCGPVLLLAVEEVEFDDLPLAVGLVHVHRELGGAA